MVYQPNAVGQLAAGMMAFLCGDDVALICAFPQERGVMRPAILEALAEIGIEADLHLPATAPARYYHEVIVICDEASCDNLFDIPNGPRTTWCFAAIDGRKESAEVTFTRTRIVRNMIQAQLELWCLEHCSPRRYRQALRSIGSPGSTAGPN
jgi:hypothetical protein